jgi:hypothetical protein
MSDLEDDLLALIGDAPDSPPAAKGKRAASPSDAPLPKKRKRVKDAGYA